MLNHVDYMLYQTELYIKSESNTIVCLCYIKLTKNDVYQQQQKRNTISYHKLITYCRLYMDFRLYTKHVIYQVILLLSQIKQYCIEFTYVFLYYYAMSHDKRHLIIVTPTLLENDNLTYDSILCYIKIKYNIIPLYIYIYILYYVILC